jgi:DNA-binding response OmpR family regulator
LVLNEYVTKYLPMRVLLLEDPRGPSDGLSRALQHHGHHVTSVAADDELRRAGRASTYDLLIVDLCLGSLDPFAFLESQSRMGQTARALLLSGDRRHRARAISLGYSERQILSRPVDHAGLLARLAGFAGTAGRRHDRLRAPELRRVITLAGRQHQTGKTTLAAHIACACLTQGLKVVTFDLDIGTRALTRFMGSRRRRRAQGDATLEIARHRAPNLADMGLDELWHSIERQRRGADIVIIDCLAVQQAELLLTPVRSLGEESDGLADLASPLFGFRGPGPFAEMVATSREAGSRPRRLDWLLVRNRRSPLAREKWEGTAALAAELSRALDLRIRPGLIERPIHRDLIRDGLTLFDLDSEQLEARLGPVGRAVRDELAALRGLLGSLVTTGKRKIIL